MRLSVIAIGDELLLGSIVDTNTPFIASHADREGWQMVYSCHTGDSAGDIRRAIEYAFTLSDVVITTGGLGPTKDDITKQVMCDIFGCRLVRDESVAANVDRIFRERGLKMNPLTASQAMVPDGCTVVPNAVGTAPIMWFERADKLLVAMPGVPRETRHVFVSEILPRLRARFPVPRAAMILHRFVNVEGISESDVNGLIDSMGPGSALNKVHVAYLPQGAYLRLRLDSDSETLLCLGVGELRKLLGGKIAYEGDATPAEALIERLRAKGLTVASAESCTGGNIARMITSVAGCSDVYSGSVVAYSNGVKRRVLGVSADALRRYGAVSLPVVEQMARGVARATRTDCAMATSGIAGPGGAVPGKPVGTVCIAVMTPGGGVHTGVYHFNGGRADVIERASLKAVMLLLRALA